MVGARTPRPSRGGRRCRAEADLHELDAEARPRATSRPASCGLPAAAGEGRRRRPPPRPRRRRRRRRAGRRCCSGSTRGRATGRSTTTRTTWFTAGPNVPWAAAVNDVLNSAGGTTSVSLAGTGWAFVGSNAAARRKTLAGQTLDASTRGSPRSTSTSPAARPNRVVLLVAVDPRRRRQRHRRRRRCATSPSPTTTSPSARCASAPESLDLPAPADASGGSVTRRSE